MRKCDAKRLFGGTYTSLGAALEMTRQAAWQLPDPLPQRYVDRLVGVAVRTGMGIPPELLVQDQQQGGKH